MKLKTLLLYTIVTVTIYGCASTDSSTDIEGTSASGGNLTESETLANENPPDSQDPMDPDTDMTAEENLNENVSANNQVGRDMNIVALVQQNPNLSTLLELIKAADMVRVLESPAPYTVFAPTNEAFAALPAGTVEALKRPENKMELTKILQAHVLPNRIRSTEMQNNMPMVTAQGDEVVVMKQGQTIKVGDATIVIPDVEASNGIVHVVDRVLMPPPK